MSSYKTLTQKHPEHEKHATLMICHIIKRYFLHQAADDWFCSVALSMMN